MVAVTIYCAIVGLLKSTFSVEIDDCVTVEKLKDKIKETKPDTIKCEAGLLQLFLPKKGEAWLTVGEANAGVSDTSDRRYLKFLDAELRDVGLEKEELGEVDRIKKLLDWALFTLELPNLVPKILRVGVDKFYTGVISSYREIADRLKDNKQVKALSELLANVRVEGGKASVPFVVLENSSGTGKTRMAFNLQAREECEIFYIVCGMPGDREQNVYSAYAERADTFQACVQSDLTTMAAMLRDDQKSLGSVGAIRRNTTLALYGFILAALRGSDKCFVGVQRSDVQAELARRKERDAKPFVFFLDEFPRIKTHRDDKGQWKRENFLRVMRNVFRSFDLAVVISSTNGTARNLVATSDRSRGSGPCLWCVVFPSFPRVDINGDYDMPDLLMDIIKHSRPLFAKIALEHVKANPYSRSYNLKDYLNEMAGTLALEFDGLKTRTEEFEIGQLCLLLCTSYEVVKSKVNDVMNAKVNLIDGHYARLDELSAFELHLDAKGLRKGKDRWKSCSVMPAPEEDILLHLTMTGGPNFHPFDEPLCTVMSKFQPPFYYDNTVQRSKGGMQLEALTLAAIVLASHAGGFGGVKFPTFLGELLFEMGVSITTPLLQDVEAAGWTQTVPFLSPPNKTWPKWLNDTALKYSMCFGSLRRTLNDERIDFQTTPNVISGECKDYTSAVSLPVMKGILKRIPEDTTIHLVVTNKLQTKYFAKESWEDFVRGQRLQRVDIYRISNGSALQPIKGMPNQSSRTMTTANRLVLFIEHGLR